MASVQRFNRGMFETYLKKEGFKYMRDSDGDFLVSFGYDESIGCALDVWLIAGGKDATILEIMVRSDRRFPRSEWGRCVAACNTWNKEKRWPKAYLFVGDPATDTAGDIRLEYQLNADAGIHQEMVDSFIATTMIGATLFWEWAKGQGMTGIAA